MLQLMGHKESDTTKQLNRIEQLEKKVTTERIIDLIT